MEIKDLVLKKDILKNVVYLKQLDTLDNFAGERGLYQLHQVGSKDGTVFNVVTKASADMFEFKSEVELVNPEFFVDESLGLNMTPALNVRAEKIVKK